MSPLDVVYRGDGVPVVYACSLPRIPQRVLKLSCLSTREILSLLHYLHHAIDVKPVASGRQSTHPHSTQVRKGYTSVAAEGWEAPGVAVVYANNDPTYAGHFKNAQFQIAAGVPLVLGEPDHYNSFRIGLFGLDKLMHVDKTIRNFEVGLDAVMAAKGM